MHAVYSDIDCGNRNDRILCSCRAPTVYDCPQSFVAIRVFRMRTFKSM